MTYEAYVSAIMCKVKLSAVNKRRIQEDLESDIATRLEHGVSMEAVVDEMGTPEEMAKSLVAALPDEMKYNGNPLRFLYLVFAVIPIIVGLLPIWKIYTTFVPILGFFNSAWEYILHEITVRFDVFIWLFSNAVLQIIICIFGYSLLKKTWKNARSH